MDLSTELREHFFGFGQVSRFPKKFAVQSHEGVCAKNNAIGITPGNIGRFSFGIQFAESVWRKRFIVQFLHEARNDLKTDIEGPQKVEAPPGG